MDFDLNEETVLLRNNAERYLRERCPSSTVKEILNSEKGYSESIWKDMADYGWLGVTYDEKYGGINSTFFNLFILFEEMGKVLLPSPFFCSAVLSGFVINEAGDEKLKEEYLPSLITGEKIFTLALMDHQGKYDFDDPKMVAGKNRDGEYVVDGSRVLVPYAHVADAILVCANVEGSNPGGPTLFKIDGKAPGQKITPLETLTGEKSSAVIFEEVKIAPKNIIGSIGEGRIMLDRILPRSIILKCGEMLGGMGRVLEMTVSYMKERHQFGRPLGSLQAVQHYCADMATYFETARLMVYEAASFLSEGIPSHKEVAMAKAWCNEAYKKCTWIGQQLHGGIGFTEEHDLHLYYKHAKESELAFGHSWFHRAKVAEAMGI